jgi:hypothetical protein
MKRSLFCLACAAAMSSCGPTQSTALIMDADVQLEAARAADGPKLAPFEYTSAEVYLHKAREEQGYADYEVAIDFARKAVKYGTEAKVKAMAARAEGAVPSLPSMPPPPPRVDGPGESSPVDSVEKSQKSEIKAEPTK